MNKKGAGVKPPARTRRVAVMLQRARRGNEDRCRPTLRMCFQSHCVCSGAVCYALGPSSSRARAQPRSYETWLSPPWSTVRLALREEPDAALRYVCVCARSTNFVLLHEKTTAPVLTTSRLVSTLPKWCGAGAVHEVRCGLRCGFGARVHGSCRVHQIMLVLHEVVGCSVQSTRYINEVITFSQTFRMTPLLQHVDGCR